MLIGKDTRRSGYMLESALVAGFTSRGMDVLLTGPLPTPAIGMLTRSMRADLGVMMSASHNPHHDNGLKFFGPDGFKLSDVQEAAIETAVGADRRLPDPGHVGRATWLEGAAERYMEFAKGTFPRGLRLDRLKIVVDAANGAAFRTAPTDLWELGAEVIEVGTAPDGFNINAGCGSTAPEACIETVRRHGADLGVSLDGDADRVHLIDETGRVADGDQVMALVAERALVAGRLRGGRLVTTIMSNGGLARHLAGHGILVERTAVGDRNVMERMGALGCNVGGEQSVHIIRSDYTTTGDGLIAALQALAALSEEDCPASAVLQRFDPMPQAARCIRTEHAARLLEAPEVRRAVASAECSPGRAGRLVVRPPGTEPVMRLMAEGDDRDRIDAALADIEEAVLSAGSCTFLTPASEIPAGAIRAAAL